MKAVAGRPLVGLSLPWGIDRDPSGLMVLRYRLQHRCADLGERDIARVLHTPSDRATSRTDDRCYRRGGACQRNLTRSALLLRSLGGRNNIQTGRNNIQPRCEIGTSATLQPRNFQFPSERQRPTATALTTDSTDYTDVTATTTATATADLSPLAVTKKEVSPLPFIRVYPCSSVANAAGRSLGNLEMTKPISRRG
jgi:hypothetical protein